MAGCSGRSTSIARRAYADAAGSHTDVDRAGHARGIRQIAGGRGLEYRASTVAGGRVVRFGHGCSQVGFVVAERLAGGPTRVLVGLPLAFIGFLGEGVTELFHRQIVAAATLDGHAVIHLRTSGGGLAHVDADEALAALHYRIDHLDMQ